MYKEGARGNRKDDQRGIFFSEVLDAPVEGAADGDARLEVPLVLKILWGLVALIIFAKPAEVI